MAVQLPDTAGYRHRCDFCNSHVTAGFRRSYGTENRRAKRCRQCDSWARIQRGSARGKDVDYPDPQENPARTGGKNLRNSTQVVTDGGEPR
jgi:hypothetical protein